MRIVSTPFVVNTIFSPLVTLTHLSISALSILFQLFACLSLYQYQTVLRTVPLYTVIKSGWMIPNFSLLKKCFGYSKSFTFQYKFKVILSFSEKCISVLIVTVMKLRINEENLHINDMNLPICEYVIYLHSFCSSISLSNVF
jgi:hypothetical protein